MKFLKMGWWDDETTNLDRIQMVLVAAIRHSDEKAIQKLYSIQSMVSGTTNQEVIERKIRQIGLKLLGKESYLKSFKTSSFPPEYEIPECRDKKEKFKNDLINMIIALGFPIDQYQKQQWKSDMKGILGVTGVTGPEGISGKIGVMVPNGKTGEECIEEFIDLGEKEELDSSSMPSLIEDENQSMDSMPDLVDEVYAGFKDENRFKWMMNVAQNSRDLDQFMLAIDYGFAGPDIHYAINEMQEDSDEHIIAKLFIQRAIKLDLVDVLIYLDMQWDIETLKCAVDNGSWRCAIYICRIYPDYVNDLLDILIRADKFDCIMAFLSNVYIRYMDNENWDVLVKKEEFHKILIDQNFSTAKKDIAIMYSDKEDWEGLKKFVNNYL